MGQKERRTNRCSGRELVVLLRLIIGLFWHAGFRLAVPFGRNDMTATISYAPFDDLIACLRRDGLTKEADLLDQLLHKTAWTTGSELMGELGLVLRKIRLEHTSDLTETCNNRLSKAMWMVKRVWLDFPE